MDTALLSTPILSLTVGLALEGTSRLGEVTGRSSVGVGGTLVGVKVAVTVRVGGTLVAVDVLVAVRVLVGSAVEVNVGQSASNSAAAAGAAAISARATVPVSP